MVDKRLSRLWYVLHTKSRFENVVNDGLAKKFIEVFLPKITVRSKRRDRKAMIRIPLFPGYLFVRTDLAPESHLEIVKTAGAVRLIGSKQGPVSVPEETIDSLKIMVSAMAGRDASLSISKPSDNMPASKSARTKLKFYPKY
jgi:transcription antitermination factor NusG